MNNGPKKSDNFGWLLVTFFFLLAFLATLVYRTHETNVFSTQTEKRFSDESLKLNDACNSVPKQNIDSTFAYSYGMLEAGMFNGNKYIIVRSAAKDDNVVCFNVVVPETYEDINAVLDEAIYEACEDIANNVHGFYIKTELSVVKVPSLMTFIVVPVIDTSVIHGDVLYHQHTPIIGTAHKCTII